MKPRVFDLLLVVSLLVLGMFARAAWNERADPLVAARYSDDIQDLHALHTRMLSEVMKSRTGIIGHYDGMVQTEAATRRVLKRLSAIPPYLPALAATELRTQVDKAIAVQAEAERLVDLFKRKNAVLRNSLRYLPVLAQEIDGRLAMADEAHALNSLVRDELLLQSWQEQAIAERVADGIEKVSAALAGAPEGHRPTLQLALLHARMVQTLTPVVRNDLTRNIVALPLSKVSQDLMHSFEHHSRLARERTLRDATAVFLLVLLCLVFGVASVMTRMRRSAIELRQTSTQLQDVLTSLREEQEKQKELSELKSRFVSMTSHEFRTPLSVIMSSSEMLDAYGDRWPIEKKTEHFARIRTSALGMTRMLEDILLIGRSDSGMLKFEPHEVELAPLCERIQVAVADSSGARQRIHTRGLDDDATVVADPALLGHILENLLGNALKYSTGPVQFVVERAQGALRLRVTDEGIGISDEDQARLFETFQRGANVGSIPGTGLGLAIVKRAVDLHGGSVSVESAVGVGTTFSVTLPVQGVAA